MVKYSLSGEIEIPMADFREFVMRYYPAKFNTEEDAVFFGLPQLDRVADTVKLPFASSSDVVNFVEPADITAQWDAYNTWLAEQK